MKSKFLYKSTNVKGILLCLALVTACTGSDFSGNENSNKNSQPRPGTSNQNPGGNPGNPVPGLPQPSTEPTKTIPPDLPKLDISTLNGGTIEVAKCSEAVPITAQANPYLLMRPAGFSINHNSCFSKKKPIDYVGAQSPIKVGFSSPICLTAGSKLYFNVDGSITNGGGTANASADGKTEMMASHCRPDQNDGLSNVTAPMISFVAVFVGDTKPPVAPEALDFTTPAARDYVTLSPKLGQVFFVGNGVTGANGPQQIIVPVGATQLWMGFNDSGSWADNAGGVSASILWAP